MVEFLGVLAVALGVFGYFFYIRGIIQGKVKPHAFSWLIWGLMTAIAFVAQVVEGGGPGAWVTGVTALFSFGFAAVGLGASSRVYITKSDWVFFSIALLTIPLWVLTGNPLWSMIIITIIDNVAMVPTFRKAYFYPDTENGFTYTLSGLKFVVSLFALETLTWTTVLYPASLVVANFVFVIMLILRKRHYARF